MALTMITLTGTILDPLSGDPAVGTVTITSPWVLSDPATPATYGPVHLVITLDISGQFSVALPATNCAGITPADWSYTLTLDTNIFCSDRQFELACDTPGGTVDLAELPNP